MMIVILNQSDAHIPFKLIFCGGKFKLINMSIR